MENKEYTNLIMAIMAIVFGIFLVSALETIKENIGFFWTWIFYSLLIWGYWNFLDYKVKPNGQ